MIKGHIAANKMLEKSTKYHPIVVGGYDQWLVSNSGRKESMDAKIMTAKLKYEVGELSSTPTSS